ncbi:MAG: nodulation protein NfeD [Proteobacteria bacterium]|nr:nodulation protein NfeD [Pseudomonadota bacterium]
MTRVWRGVALALVFACAAPAAPTLAGGHLNAIRIAGSINPASSDFIQRAIAQSTADGAVALILELDTPGGLVSATKDIIQAMLNASVPVIVYVSPQGAWAGSAGTFITIAGHVAAMAPGTSIGAAHPVGIGLPGGGGGGDGADEQKKQQDVASEKAENLLVAANESELLAKIDGRKVKVAGAERILATAGAEVRRIEMSLLQQFMHVLASPDIAMMLLMAGLLGLYVEFTQPGLVLPGVLGAASLILGAIALQILPFSWLGLIVFLAGVGLLIAEVLITSYGLLFLLGVACLLVGGMMIFDLPEVSDLRVSFWAVLVPGVAGMAAFAAVVLFSVGRSMRRRPAAGVGEMIGMVGRVVSALQPEGSVFVRGEHWKARADEPLVVGDRVEIVAVDGLRLRVRRAPPER